MYKRQVNALPCRGDDVAPGAVLQCKWYCRRRAQSRPKSRSRQARAILEPRSRSAAKRRFRLAASGGYFHGAAPRISREMCIRDSYQYYGRPTNYHSIRQFYRRVCRIWREWLSRRTRGQPLTWDRYSVILRQHPLLLPRITHAWVGAGSYA